MLKIQELSLACFFLARLFKTAPDKQMLQDLQNIKALDWMLSDADEKELDYFTQFKESLNENPDNLAVDYAMLFVGPDVLKASPWASTYLDEEQLVFGLEAANVQKFYEKYQMQRSNTAKEPADHLGLEFQFIGTILTHLEQADTQEAQQYIDKDLQLFLQNHFLLWVPECLKSIEQYATTDFYKTSAKLALCVVQRFYFFLT